MIMSDLLLAGVIIWGMVVILSWIKDARRR